MSVPELFVCRTSVYSFLAVGKKKSTHFLNVITKSF